jgi:hypothetical protein
MTAESFASRLTERSSASYDRPLRRNVYRHVDPPTLRDQSRPFGDVDESIDLYVEALDLVVEQAGRYPILANLGEAYCGRCVVARDDAPLRAGGGAFLQAGPAGAAGRGPRGSRRAGDARSAVWLLLTLDGDRSELAAAVEAGRAIFRASGPDSAHAGSAYAAACALSYAPLLHLVRGQIEVDLLDEELMAWMRVARTRPHSDPRLRNAHYAVGLLSLEQYALSGERADLDRAIVGSAAPSLAHARHAPPLTRGVPGAAGIRSAQDGAGARCHSWRPPHASRGAFCGGGVTAIPHPPRPERPGNARDSPSIVARCPARTRVRMHPDIR